MRFSSFGGNQYIIEIYVLGEGSTNWLDAKTPHQPGQQVVNRARIAISSQIQQNESIRKFVLLSLLKMPPGKQPLNLARIKSSTGPRAAKNTTGTFRTYRGGVALEKAVQGCAHFPHFSGEMWQNIKFTYRIVMNGRRSVCVSRVRFRRWYQVGQHKSDAKNWYVCCILPPKISIWDDTILKTFFSKIKFNALHQDFE